MHLSEPRTHETVGTLTGLGMTGAFHEWVDGDKERRDQQLGLRAERVLSLAGHLTVMDSSGVREIGGLFARRQVTEDFIDSGAFTHHPESVASLGAGVLPDGRAVFRLRIAPPGGETYTVSIDANTWLVDQKSYLEHDAAQTETYYDYRVVDGMLVPFTEIDSNGDVNYDIVARVTGVTADEPISPDIFVAFVPNVVDAEKPVTVKVQMQYGLVFTDVTIAGKSYHFLVDSGSQGNVIDPRVSNELGLHPQGTLEISGAARTASLGTVQMPDMYIGSVKLPAHQATVISLSGIVGGEAHVDGVLGYPFLAVAEVRIDPERGAMTIAKPGSLSVDGERISVDTDRELPEISGEVDRVETRLLVDTGNTNELLLFKSFISDHPGLIFFAGSKFVPNFGIGGSTTAVGAVVDELQIGSVVLYNRNANIILASSGAFADKNDGGNVGFGSLKNFVFTFDLANRAMYLQRGSDFDDGRYRQRTEPKLLHPPRS